MGSFAKIGSWLGGPDGGYWKLLRDFARHRCIVTEDLLLVGRQWWNGFWGRKTAWIVIVAPDRTGGFSGEKKTTVLKVI